MIVTTLPITLSFDLVSDVISLRRCLHQIGPYTVPRWQSLSHNALLTAPESTPLVCIYVLWVKIPDYGQDTIICLWPNFVLVYLTVLPHWPRRPRSYLVSISNCFSLHLNLSVYDSLTDHHVWPMLDLEGNTQMHLTWICIIYKESSTLTLIAIGYKCLTDVGLLDGQKRKQYLLRC